MPYATLDGIKTHYLKQGSGPCLLMMAPRGFNSCIDSWRINKWQEMDALNTLAKHFTIVAYDRREAGLSGGRVEVLTWEIFARHGKLLLEHLGVDKAWIIGPCMGVSVATKFAAIYPEACIGLMLPQPVGGYRWMSKMRGFFDQHIAFVRRHGLAGVRDRALKERKNFQEDPEAGPWGIPIVNDADFAARFTKQDAEHYLQIVAATRDAMFGDTFVCGAGPEELINMDIPAFVWAGDDPSHSTSAGHQLRELMPNVRFWDLHPSRHTASNQLEQLLLFKNDVEQQVFPGKNR